MVACKSLDHIGSKFCLISIRWLKRLILVLNVLLMLKSRFWAWPSQNTSHGFDSRWGLRKFFSQVFWLENTSLLFIQFLFNYLVAYGRLKSKDNFKFFVLKVVVDNGKHCLGHLVAKGQSYKWIAFQSDFFWGWHQHASPNLSPWLMPDRVYLGQLKCSVTRKPCVSVTKS